VHTEVKAARSRYRLGFLISENPSHTALSSRCGYSQVLFLGILSRHVVSMTLRFQRVGRAYLTAVLIDLLLGAFNTKKTELASACYHRKSIGTINKLKITFYGLCASTVYFLLGWGCEPRPLAPRSSGSRQSYRPMLHPSQAHIDVVHTSPIS
jgi:hypothetical protein